MTAHRFDPTILREYDIRGIVGRTLTEDDARAIGASFGTMVAEASGRRVVVGYDGRLSSPQLETALVEGLCGAGMDVERIGLGPTPMLYYAAKSREADGGIMITGSHNPPDYNGFKMVLGNRSFYGADIQRLGRISAEGRLAEGSGAATDVSVLEEYVARLARDYAGRRPLRVAWDPGNGSAGPATRMLTQRLPGTHLLLNDTVDGTFPAHHPDPTIPDNLKQLITTVLEEGCDLGIAFDGDGDRIGVVDDRGRIVWGDQYLAIVARAVLAAQPGATIIADVKTSQTLFDEVARLGGKPLMWKTGHSLIKTKMAEVGAPLAGEMSGHVFFADRYYGFDDAPYAALRLLEVVANAAESLSEMRDRLPAMVNTPELRIQSTEERKFAVVEEVRDRLSAQGAEVDAIDGVRVRTADGWWLLRASNTQDVLVARCEAADQAGLERLKAALGLELAASGVEFRPD